MVDVIDNNGEPPAELRLAWMCGDHLLPDSGGVLEQDYALMTKITACKNVYSALSHLRNSSGAQIHNLTDSERKIIRYLMDERLL